MSKDPSIIPRKHLFFFKKRIAIRQRLRTRRCGAAAIVESSEPKSGKQFRDRLFEHKAISTPHQQSPSEREHHAPFEGVSCNDLVDTLTNNGCRAQLVGADIAIQGMSIDSRTVEKGCLFVCKGASFKPQFLSMALTSGASAYMCEKSAEEALIHVAPNASHIVG